MNLSRAAQYALQTMTHLARFEGGGRVSTRDLTAATGISGPYLSKIMRRLTVAGLLTSKRGHYGGFRLVRRPSEVRLVEILRAVDFDPDTEECLFGWGDCCSASPCPDTAGRCGSPPDAGC